MSLSSTLSVAFRAHELGSGDLSTPVSDTALDYSQENTSGVTAGKNDVVFTDTRTITGNDDLDLYGTLAAVFSTFSPATIVRIVIKNKATTTGYKLTLGNGSNPCFAGLFGAGTHTIIIPPGGVFVWDSPIDGITVTNTTADVWRIASGSNPVTYDIAVTGRSS